MEKSRVRQRVTEAAGYDSGTGEEVKVKFTWCVK